MTLDEKAVRDLIRGALLDPPLDGIHAKNVVENPKGFTVAIETRDVYPAHGAPEMRDGHKSITSVNINIDIAGAKTQIIIEEPGQSEYPDIGKNGGIKYRVLHQPKDIDLHNPNSHSIVRDYIKEWLDAKFGRFHTCTSNGLLGCLMPSPHVPDAIKAAGTGNIGYFK